MNLLNLVLDWINIKLLGRVPIFYFYQEKNVGDLLTPYLVKKITGKAVHNVKSRRFAHLIGVGSIIHRAKKNSDIWGAGILDENKSWKHRVSGFNICALRGYRSAEILFGFNLNFGDIALGDPGVLMPKFFNPQVDKKFVVGVVPHYVDSDSEYIFEIPGVQIIDVRSDPETFIIDLLKCEYILSSSLHGLILADAYGINNKWVSFSEKLAGGDFKFSDYYSTTDSKDEHCFKINSRADFFRVVDRVEEYAAVKLFLESREKLLKSFPSKYY